MSAGSKMDLLLAMAKTINNGGRASVIMYYSKGKNEKLLHSSNCSQKREE